MRKLLLTCCLTLMFSYGFSQQAGLGVVVGVPQNEFRLATEAEGYGFNLHALFPVGGTEVINFGGSLNYMIYGYNAQNKDLLAEIKVNEVVIDELLIPLRVTNINSIFGLHANMRVMAPTEGVKPYFEGLFGFRYISTNTRITDRSDNNRWSDEDSDLIVRKTNLDAWVLSYGGGGGLQFAINDDMYLDLRAYYLRGGEADFYDGSDTKKWEVTFTDPYDPETYESEEVTGDDLDFDATPKNSTTDMLMFQLGLSVHF